MKRTIIVSAVAILSWMGSAVAAGILMQPLPPILAPRPIPTITVDFGAPASTAVVRPERIDDRLRAEALIQSQA